jgi:predicted membrane channel-forming protein YqfA (hemolysin III family)
MAREMKSIWFFVGLMLLTMGAVVFISGIYYYNNPERGSTVLNDLHADIWWGAVIIIAGAIFFFSNLKKSRKEK